ncbi:MAG: hypothetical protein AB1641_23415 [Thermodesulfobacteriota bacterium]
MLRQLYKTRYEPTSPKKSRLAGFLAGGLKLLIALVMMWVGLHSFLIGWAYSLEKGSGVPRLVGFALLFGGLPLLLAAIRQMLENLKPADSDQENRL